MGHSRLVHRPVVERRILNRILLFDLHISLILWFLSQLHSDGRGPISNKVFHLTPTYISIHKFEHAIFVTFLGKFERFLGFLQGDFSWSNSDGHAKSTVFSSSRLHQNRINEYRDSILIFVLILLRELLSCFILGLSFGNLNFIGANFEGKTEILRLGTSWSH